MLSYRCIKCGWFHLRQNWAKKVSILSINNRIPRNLPTDLGKEFYKKYFQA